jgi:hypothetical protein
VVQWYSRPVVAIVAYGTWYSGIAYCGVLVLWQCGIAWVGEVKKESALLRRSENQKHIVANALHEREEVKI